MTNTKKNSVAPFTKEEIIKIMNNVPQLIAQLDKKSLDDFIIRIKCDICKQSSGTCEYCNAMMCVDCFNDAYGCVFENCKFENLCDNCRKTCSICNYGMCPKHLTKKCEECDHLTCDDCYQKYVGHRCLKIKKKRRKKN